MDNKIFLGKYRVSGDEIEAVGESAGSPLAYEAQEIDSRKKVVVELVPAGSLKVTEREQLAAEATAAKKLKVGRTTPATRLALASLKIGGSMGNLPRGRYTVVPRVRVAGTEVILGRHVGSGLPLDVKSSASM